MPIVKFITELTNNKHTFLIKIWINKLINTCIIFTHFYNVHF